MQLHQIPPLSHFDTHNGITNSFGDYISARKFNSGCGGALSFKINYLCWWRARILPFYGFPSTLKNDKTRISSFATKDCKDHPNRPARIWSQTLIPGADDRVIYKKPNLRVHPLRSDTHQSKLQETKLADTPLAIRRATYKTRNLRDLEGTLLGISFLKAQWRGGHGQSTQLHYCCKPRPGHLALSQSHQTKPPCNTVDVSATKLERSQGARIRKLTHALCGLSICLGRFTWLDQFRKWVIVRTLQWPPDRLLTITTHDFVSWVSAWSTDVARCNLLPYASDSALWFTPMTLTIASECPPQLSPNPPPLDLVLADLSLNQIFVIFCNQNLQNANKSSNQSKKHRVQTSMVEHRTWIEQMTLWTSCSTDSFNDWMIVVVTCSVDSFNDLTVIATVENVLNSDCERGLIKRSSARVLFRGFPLHSWLARPCSSWPFHGDRAGWSFHGPRMKWWHTMEWHVNDNDQSRPLLEFEKLADWHSESKMQWQETQILNQNRNADSS